MMTIRWLLLFSIVSLIHAWHRNSFSQLKLPLLRRMKNAPLKSHLSTASLTSPLCNNKKKILVLGGDGFCGWPTSLHLSSKGHSVVIVDNFARRKADVELGTSSLTPITPIDQRIRTWNQLSAIGTPSTAEGTAEPLKFEYLDVAEDYGGLLALIQREKPDTIIHFAEQRAAPYSMRDSRRRRLTVDGNLGATHNLLAALVESGIDAHVIHLGTMGVYGYGPPPLEDSAEIIKTATKCAEKTQGTLPSSTAALATTALITGVEDTTNEDVKKTVSGLKSRIGTVASSSPEEEEVPEGYLTVTLPNGKRSRILHPAYPGSVYHLTKCLDALLFQFYARNDGIRVTDLHQGIVWGTHTQETTRAEELVNRFDYDGDYGTVLNRFLAQAALDIPLTVYGSGGQTRAFIHIQDTVKCVSLAVDNPPASAFDGVEIFNQVAETQKVADLAQLVSSRTGVPVEYLPNPRHEAAENELRVSNRKFRALGLQPTLLADGLLDEVQHVAERYRHRADITRVRPSSFWNKKRAAAAAAADSSM